MGVSRLHWPLVCQSLCGAGSLAFNISQLTSTLPKSNAHFFLPCMLHDWLGMEAVSGPEPQHKGGQQSGKQGSLRSWGLLNNTSTVNHLVATCIPWAIACSGHTVSRARPTQPRRRSIGQRRTRCAVMPMVWWSSFWFTIFVTVSGTDRNRSLPEMS